MRLFGTFVGIDQYVDPQISSLKWAAADADTFHALVNDGLRPRDRQLFLLKNQEATKVCILKTIGEEIVRQAAPEDIVLLFFAGHGSPETDGSPDRAARYLIAHDTEYNSIYATGLDFESDFRRLLERMRAKLVVVIIDACFSGRVVAHSRDPAFVKYDRSSERSSR